MTRISSKAIQLSLADSRPGSTRKVLLLIALGKWERPRSQQLPRCLLNFGGAAGKLGMLTIMEHVLNDQAGDLPRSAKGMVACG